MRTAPAGRGGGPRRSGMPVAPPPRRCGPTAAAPGRQAARHTASLCAALAAVHLALFQHPRRTGPSFFSECTIVDRVAIKNDRKPRLCAIDTLLPSEHTCDRGSGKVGGRLPHSLRLLAHRGI